MVQLLLESTQYCDLLPERLRHHTEVRPSVASFRWVVDLGSQKLVDALSALGFTSTLVHDIGETKAKLSVHKKHIDLREDEWGCDKPVYRAKAISPTFGECIVIFFVTHF